MQAEEQRTTDKVINDIYQNDKKARFVSYILILVIILGVIFSLFIQFIILQKSNQQIEEVQKVVKKISDDTQHQHDVQTKFIECLARYFAEVDRDDKTINFDDCSIVSNPSVSNQNSSGVSQLPKSNTSQSSGTSQNGNSDIDNQSEDHQQPPPPPTTSPSEPPPAVKVCLPLTNICLEV